MNCEEGRQKAVDAAMDVLDDALAILDNKVDELAAGMAKVLREEEPPPVRETEKRPPAACELAGCVTAAAERVQRVVERVEGLRGRLEA